MGAPLVPQATAGHRLAEGGGRSQPDKSKKAGIGGVPTNKRPKARNLNGSNGMALWRRMAVHNPEVEMLTDKDINAVLIGLKKMCNEAARKANASPDNHKLRVELCDAEFLFQRVKGKLCGEGRAR